MCDINLYVCQSSLCSVVVTALYFCDVLLNVGVLYITHIYHDVLWCGMMYHF